MSKLLPGVESHARAEGVAKFLLSEDFQSFPIFLLKAAWQTLFLTLSQ